MKVVVVVVHGGGGAEISRLLPTVLNSVG